MRLQDQLISLEDRLEAGEKGYRRQEAPKDINVSARESFGKGRSIERSTNCNSRNKIGAAPESRLDFWLGRFYTGFMTDWGDLTAISKLASFHRYIEPDRILFKPPFDLAVSVENAPEGPKLKYLQHRASRSRLYQRQQRL